MAWSENAYHTAFDEEAGDAATLATATEKTRWFNEGQARLNVFFPDSQALSWVAGDAAYGLPNEFVQVQKLVYDTGVTEQEWEVYGKQLVIYNPTGATQAGSGTIYFWREWASVAGGSELPARLDYACLYYALHRFYRKLVSNRVQYTRYSTLLGANAVSVADLQAESDRLYQDYVDARGDEPPLPPASFYRS